MAFAVIAVYGGHDRGRASGPEGSGGTSGRMLMRE